MNTRAIEKFIRTSTVPICSFFLLFVLVTGDSNLGSSFNFFNENFGVVSTNDVQYSGAVRYGVFQVKTHKLAGIMVPPSDIDSKAAVKPLDTDSETSEMEIPGRKLVADPELPSSEPGSSFGVPKPPTLSVTTSGRDQQLDENSKGDRRD